MGCDTVVLQMFYRDLTLPSSGQKSKPQKKKKQSDMENIKNKDSEGREGDEKTKAKLH